MFTTRGIIAIVLTLTLIIVGTCAITVYVVRETERLYIYPNCGIVTRVNKVANEITIVDSFGEEWRYGESDGWTKGNHVAMTIHSNGTPETIEDDIILKIEFMCY